MHLHPLKFDNEYAEPEDSVLVLKIDNFKKFALNSTYVSTDKVLIALKCANPNYNDAKLFKMPKFYKKI